MGPTPLLGTAGAAVVFLLVLTLGWSLGVLLLLLVVFGAAALGVCFTAGFAPAWLGVVLDTAASAVGTDCLRTSAAAVLLADGTDAAATGMVSLTAGTVTVPALTAVCCIAELLVLGSGTTAVARGATTLAVGKVAVLLAAGLLGTVTLLGSGPDTAGPTVCVGVSAV